MIDLFNDWVLSEMCVHKMYYRQFRKISSLRCILWSPALDHYKQNQLLQLRETYPNPMYRDHLYLEENSQNVITLTDWSEGRTAVW